METKKEIYLFICYGNLNRSPTAEAVCNLLAQENGLNIKAISAGFSLAAKTTINKKLLNQADKIFVMESYMKEALIEKYDQPAHKIVCLDIPDIYARNEPELVMRIRLLIQPYL